MTASISSRWKLWGLVAGIAALLSGPWCSVVSAGLTLDIKSTTGGNAVAINGATNAVTVEFYAKVTGTNALADDGIQSFYSAFYSTNVGVAPYTLTAGNLSWNWAADAVKFTNKTTVPAVAKLDGDGDLDLGSTLTSNAAGWMFVDAFPSYVSDNNSGGTINSTEQHIGTLVYTQTAFNGTHGITQIYAKGRSLATTFYRQDGVNKMLAYDSANSRKVTLYVTASANAGEDQTFDLTTHPGDITLNGTASVGSMNTWSWDRWDGAGWVALTSTSADSATLPWSSFGITEKGDYRVRLKTTYAGVVLDGSPSNNNTSTDEMLLHIVPEPGTALFLAIGGVGMAWFRRRRRTA
jgi:hypothetical protein